MVTALVPPFDNSQLGLYNGLHVSFNETSVKGPGMSHGPPAELTPVVLPVGRNRPFDPPSELGQMREERALRPLAYPDGHVGWLVTGHALAREILSDRRFSARLELQRSPVRRPATDQFYGRPAPSGWFLNMDPPEHTRYRRLLGARFTMSRMETLRAHIERIVEEQLDAMEDQGSPVDLVETFASPIPAHVMCALFGIPYAENAEFQRVNEVLLSVDSTSEQGAAAWKTATDYLRVLADHKRVEPDDDLLSDLVRDGDLTDEEVAGVGLLLITAGLDTTASMLALGAFALLTHRPALEAFRSTPTVVDSTVEELLRYLTIFHHGRTRTPLEDVELDGQLIRAGECVTISLPAANRDPDVFSDPDQLCVTRETRGHLAFGYGVHQCIGQHLARVEMQIGFSALFRRFSQLRLAVTPEAVPLRVDMATYGVHRLPVAW